MFFFVNKVLFQYYCMIHCLYYGMEIYTGGPDDVSTFSSNLATLPH